MCWRCHRGGRCWVFVSQKATGWIEGRNVHWELLNVKAFISCGHSVGSQHRHTVNRLTDLSPSKRGFGAALITSTNFMYLSDHWEIFPVLTYILYQWPSTPAPFAACRKVKDNDEKKINNPGKPPLLPSQVVQAWNKSSFYFWRHRWLKPNCIWSHYPHTYLCCLVSC